MKINKIRKGMAIAFVGVAVLGLHGKSEAQEAQASGLFGRITSFFRSGTRLVRRQGAPSANIPQASEDNGVRRTPTGTAVKYEGLLGENGPAVKFSKTLVDFQKKVVEEKPRDLAPLATNPEALLQKRISEVSKAKQSKANERVFKKFEKHSASKDKVILIDMDYDEQTGKLTVTRHYEGGGISERRGDITGKGDIITKRNDGKGNTLNAVIDQSGKIIEVKSNIQYVGKTKKPKTSVNNAPTPGSSTEAPNSRDGEELQASGIGPETYSRYEAVDYGASRRSVSSVSSVSSGN